jgi:hypothetical protein
MDTNTAEEKKRTITLTGRPPVTIKDSEWRVIAVASHHDGQVASQANRTWWIRVRQHDDGRTLVYGCHESSFQNEPNLRAGFLLPADDGSAIADAIYRVADEITAARWVAESCIADLPAEEI